MRARNLILAATLCVCACSSEVERQRIEVERQRVAVEEKKQQDAEIERRAQKLAEEKKQQDKEVEQKAKQLAIEISREQKVSEAKGKAERKHQVLEDIQKSPAPFFQISGLEFFDKGIVNRYQQLSKITLTNKSSFTVKDIRGKVDFLDSGDETVASIPVRLEGLLPGRGTRTYSGAEIAGNTVQTDASKSRFVITSVAVNDEGL